MPAFTHHTPYLRFQCRPNEFLWSAAWPEVGVAITDVVAAVTLNGESRRLEGPGESPKVERRKDVLGEATEISFPLHLCDLLRVTMHLRIYDDGDVLTLQAEVENIGPREGALEGLELASRARLDLGGPGRDSRAWLCRSLGHPLVEPLLGPEGTPFRVDGQEMATLAQPATGRTFTLGFLTGTQHRPVVRVEYTPSTDEITLTGLARWHGQRLAPGETIHTDTLLLRADSHPHAALETYGNLLAQANLPPRRTPQAHGWCSWYACRLPISHRFALANARIVADRFRDLGLDLILLDHGWQGGDLCGDWEADPQDFPQGLEGLAQDLEALGLKLGLWIAPTDIAHTSRLFAEHPEWMLRDDHGRPQTTWRWFWEPNPLQCQLDATQPGAYAYLVETIRRLRQAGSTYFKIDFIAGSAGEHLYPADPHQGRGWAPLREAMRAVREGAGDAYVRFCQTPPLLSVGLADGVFATNDTLDGGATTWPILREVFRMSAAQYWTHGRLYNHDACDLSLRAVANTEESRLRVMMLALSGSSILFSDDLTILPEERIEMMQKCLPGFPEAARPLNLFTSEMPDLWHLKQQAAGLEWDLLALFNFDPHPRDVMVSWSDLGQPPGKCLLVREFWTEHWLGKQTGSASLPVPGLSARLFSLWPDLDRPQFVGTDLHLSQGAAELKALHWDETASRLTGTLCRAPGLQGQVFLHVPPPWGVASASLPLQRKNGGLWAVEVVFEQEEVTWEVEFQSKGGG